MLFLAECVRICTTWQAIPFKKKFYSHLKTTYADKEYHLPRRMVAIPVYAQTPYGWLLAIGCVCGGGVRY